METTRYTSAVCSFRIRKDDPMSSIMASAIAAIGYGLSAKLLDGIEITAITEYISDTYALDKQELYQAEEFSAKLHSDGITDRVASIIAPPYQCDTGYVGCNVVKRAVNVIDGVPMLSLTRDVSVLHPSILINGVSERLAKINIIRFDIRNQFPDSSLLPMRTHQVKCYQLSSPHEVGFDFTVDLSRNLISNSDDSLIGAKGAMFDKISLTAHHDYICGDYIEAAMKTAAFKFMTAYFELISEPQLLAADIMGVEITQSSKADGQGV